jgi:CHAT domain-containing protein
MADAEKAMDGTSENGILTAYEVMNLLLDNTEIVVVSACETGLGDVKNGEGVYGLQRAFQVAGSKAIIMSLWKVNDAATQELMSGFYKHFALTNNKQTAFKKAQLELKTKFKDPYFWGAFVMVE